MAKKSAPTDPLKAKEAKQKKIAIGGAVLLVILLIVQVPKIMKQTSHSAAPPAQPSSTPQAGPTPAVTPAATTPSTSFTAAPATPSSSASGLLSEATPTAAIGQLSSFGTFVSKDPFAAQGPAAGSAAAAPSGGKKSGGATTTAPPPTPPAPPTATVPAAAPTSAVISVNGLKAQVAVGSDFPVNQPFFHLVSATAHTVKISIAGGSLADGSGTVTLHEGKTVTLQNTTDGTRYTLELFPQGTSLTATGPAVAPPSTTTAPVTPLPAGTTTTTGTTTTGP